MYIHSAMYWVYGQSYTQGGGGLPRGLGRPHGMSPVLAIAHGASLLGCGCWAVAAGLSRWPG